MMITTRKVGKEVGSTIEVKLTVIRMEIDCTTCIQLSFLNMNLLFMLVASNYAGFSLLST